MAPQDTPLMVEERTFRKHWVAYTRLAFWVGVPLAIDISVANGLTGGGASFFTTVGDIIFLVLVYKLIYLRTVRWTVNATGVTVARGILPWRTSSYFVPYASIFESFSTRSFLGHFLNYGTVVLRRSEGVTSAWSASRMANARLLSGLINDGVTAGRSSTPSAPAVIDLRGGDTLTDLARLKANGDITAEEYSRMKDRILNA